MCQRTQAFFTASPDTEVALGQPCQGHLLFSGLRVDGLVGSRLRDDERVLQGREEVIPMNLFEDAAVVHSSPHLG